jgi:hypothetical protein
MINMGDDGDVSQAFYGHNVYREDGKARDYSVILKNCYGSFYALRKLARIRLFKKIDLG